MSKNVTRLSLLALYWWQTREYRRARRRYLEWAEGYEAGFIETQREAS